MVSLLLLPQVCRLHVKVFHYDFLLCDDYMNMDTFHSFPPVWGHLLYVVGHASSSKVSALSIMKIYKQTILKHFF